MKKPPKRKRHISPPNVSPPVSEKESAPHKETGGRDSLCSPGMIESFAESIGNGMTFERTCLKHNVSEVTGYNWKKWGKEGREPYLSFLKAIKRAETDWEESLLQSIRKAAETPSKTGTTQWQAAAWLLERRLYKDWAAAERVIKEDDSGKARDIASARLSEALAKLK